MDDHVEEVNVNNTLPSANTFSVKIEECQGDSFMDVDEVCFSETVVAISKTELQDHVWLEQLKQYEVSTTLDNIKTEFSSFEVIEVQSDPVKKREGISADDVKIEFDNGLLYCDHCQVYYKDYCIKCGMLVHILNKSTLNNTDSRAREGLPSDILEIKDCFGQFGVYALRIIPTGVKFGPFTGLCATKRPCEIKDGKFMVDKHKSKYLNWMQYINPTRNSFEGNLHAFRCEENLYYQTTRQIQAGEALLVYFDGKYADSLNKNVGVDFINATEQIVRDVFACTYCSLGYRSESYLVKHKTVCLGDTAGKFSREELTQCPFCKIHLDPKDYYNHHMAYCCERNVRRCILPIPPAQQTTAALNGRKRCLRQVYTCEQCNYTTKYKADLKKHHIQHCDVKIYKCGICNRRFKTKQSLRQHFENIHINVTAKTDQQGHSRNDYLYIQKVIGSSAEGQIKIFKCSLCGYQTKYLAAIGKHINSTHLKEFNYKCDNCKYKTNSKHYFERHVKTKHFKEFDYKCYSCEFRTNYKNVLERHIKSKHLNEFDHKCELCEFRTNHKLQLEYHIKTQHLKEFDYKCDSCEFRTNLKSNLESHIKTKHLNEFDFKCDTCEFRTNHKNNLKRHIKTNHLNEFDYECESCEFRTNLKSNLEKHIKTVHLKELDYKCDLCEFRANLKTNLETHVKTKHLNEFDYECGSCEFRTNNRRNFERHIKAMHWKEFDYKCDSCEFRTNLKSNLEKHIKTVHLNEFDYKCDACEFGTNFKITLARHLKTNHLNVFDYKCDSCEFRTNIKINLGKHVKTKHLNEFDYKCDSCEFRTNKKNYLKEHIKTKHLNEYDYKCDSCGFRTNNKSNLGRHIKAIHLNVFDYKCDKCEFRTNFKSNLERHVKTKH